MLESATQVVLWVHPGKSSCVSELENSSLSSPLPVGSQLCHNGQIGLVTAGRTYEGMILHRNSVLVQCAGVIQVWFVPMCQPSRCPVPKKPPTTKMLPVKKMPGRK